MLELLSGSLHLLLLLVLSSGGDVGMCVPLGGEM
jgi:hypothetical protein